MMLSTDVEHLRRRKAPLDMSATEFRNAGHGLVDQIADWLEKLPTGPVTHDESPADVRRALHADRGLPASGTEPGELLDEAADLLFRHSLFNGHPRFFGYITSSPAPIGALGDLLAAAAIIIGRYRSGLLPTLMPKNPGGAMPTTVKGTSFTVIRRPTTAASPPKCESQ